MFHMGTPELIIILVIVILIFGVGRIGKIAGELGKGVKAFRSGIQDETPAEPQEEKEVKG